MDGQQPVTQTIRVSGMFCAHCEQRIQETLQKIPGVLEAHASFANETVEVTFRADEVRVEELKRSIEELGYEPEHDGSQRLQLASVVVILLALYVIARHLGWTRVFSIFPTAGSNTGLFMLFVIGMLTSLHCIVMCGGLNLTQGLLAVRGGRGICLSNLAYNGGRVLSYSLIGGLAGGLGSVVSPNGRLRGLLLVLAGVAMTVAALNMLGCFRPLRKIGLHWPTGLHSRLSRLFGQNSSLTIGLLNGLMPCGPLQTMQLYALSTGSALSGALSMFLFSLGTIPLMFGFGFFSGRLNRRYARHLLSLSAILVLLMGLQAVLNGLAIGGVSPISQRGRLAAREMNGHQIIRTEVDYGSYPSISVKKDLPVEWTVFVPQGKLNGCNGQLQIPAFNLDIKLHEGENVIRFTPTRTGNFAFSCWMGMITGTIEVVE